jgi:hypothetical protein
MACTHAMVAAKIMFVDQILYDLTIVFKPKTRRDTFKQLVELNGTRVKHLNLVRVLSPL